MFSCIQWRITYKAFGLVHGTQDVLSALAAVPGRSGNTATVCNMSMFQYNIGDILILFVVNLTFKSNWTSVFYLESQGRSQD